MLSLRSLFRSTSAPSHRNDQTTRQPTNQPTWLDNVHCVADDIIVHGTDEAGLHAKLQPAKETRHSVGCKQPWIGAALLQDDRPIYASRALTDTETRSTSTSIVFFQKAERHRMEFYGLATYRRLRETANMKIISIMPI